MERASILISYRPATDIPLWGEPHNDFGNVPFPEAQP
jgi:hypothetical protein